MNMKDGGPAFPMPMAGITMDVDQYHLAQAGMSLRDWFASQEQTHPPKAWMECHFHGDDIESSGVVKHEALAQWRYEMADAMLAARE
jgi:hypothetical protein